MSYNNYNQGNNPAYGQSNPYGQPNPYDQRSDNYSDGYGQTGTRPGVQQQSSSRYDEERAGGYEMSSMAQNNDPNRMLNEIRALDNEIDQLEAELDNLQRLQKRFLADPSGSQESPLAREIESSNDRVMQSYRGLTLRVKSIKQNPESGNPRNAPNVGKIDRRLKAAIHKCQQADRQYREEHQEQIARQYRIARPDASEQEVREAVESDNPQVFSQALMNQNRRGEAQSVQRNVKARHEAIQKLERDMMELAQLFNDLEAAVIQQEAAVTQIETKAGDITQDVQKANTELTGAIDKAKAARRKKWICLGIVILIIIIIAVVVAVAVTITQRNNNNSNNNNTNP